MYMEMTFIHFILYGRLSSKQSNFYWLSWKQKEIDIQATKEMETHKFAS